MVVLPVPAPGLEQERGVKVLDHAVRTAWSAGARVMSLTLSDLA
jgi:hypothetical protein